MDATEQKKIPFITAVLMNINIIVGSGIYISPPLMAKQAGGLSFLGWIIAGLLLLPIVLSIALAARLFPGDGGFYNYCKTALGERWGFIANWAYLLGYMGTVAAITSCVRDLLIKDPINWTFIANYPIVFYLAFVAALTLLNMISIRMIGKIQSTITMLKLIPLILMLGVIYFYWNPHFDYQFSRLGDLGGTVSFVLFSFLGFESCSNIGHYIQGGTSKVFSVILLAFSISLALYVIFHLGILHIMGPDALATYGVHALPKFMGFSAATASLFATLLLADMLLSFTNTGYGASLNNISSINILAKSGLLFNAPWLAKLNKNGMPANAAIIHAFFILALIICVPNTTILTALTNTGVFVAFFLTLMAVFVQSLRARNYGILLIATLGFISITILANFIWLKLGDTNLMRLLYAMPLIVGIPAGYLMYRQAKKQNSAGQNS